MELKGIECSHSTPTVQLQAVEMESPLDTTLNNLLIEFDVVFQEP